MSNDMTTAEQIRWQVQHAYVSLDWQADVACMSDEQVYTIYMRLLNQKIIKGVK